MDLALRLVPALLGIVVFLLLYSSGISGISISLGGEDISLLPPIAVAFAVVVSLTVYSYLDWEASVKDSQR